MKRLKKAWIFHLVGTSCVYMTQGDTFEKGVENLRKRIKHAAKYESGSKIDYRDDWLVSNVKIRDINHTPKKLPANLLGSESFGYDTYEDTYWWDYKEVFVDEKDEDVNLEILLPEEYFSRL